MPGVNQLNETQETEPRGETEFHVETLLLEIREDRLRARRREAIFLSVIVHLCVVILLLVNPKFFHQKSPLQNPQELVYHYRQQHLTFLASPLKTPKPKHPVHSNVISDRDREFKKQSKLLDSLSSAVNGSRPAAAPRPTPRQGGGSPARTAVNRPPVPALAGGVQNPNRTQAQQQSAKTQTAKNNGLHLEDVPQTPPQESPKIPLGEFSASNVLKHAIEQAARDRASAGQGIVEMGQLPQQSGGYPGPGGGAPGQVGAGVQILTNTQGVDFAPYLQRIVEVVRRNWYSVMPEVARMGRKGRVVVIFNINQNGSVPGLNLAGQSGTHSLDQAALAAISASNPFPPLPSQFHGPFITLQFSFFYNLNPGQN